MKSAVQWCEGFLARVLKPGTRGNQVEFPGSPAKKFQTPNFQTPKKTHRVRVPSCNLCIGAFLAFEHWRLAFPPAHGRLGLRQCLVRGRVGKAPSSESACGLVIALQYPRIPLLRRDASLVALGLLPAASLPNKWTHIFSNNCVDIGAWGSRG